MLPTVGALFEGPPGQRTSNPREPGLAELAAEGKAPVAVFSVVTGAVLGQGAGTEELLDCFDALRAEHEKMGPAEFNDDATYKAGIILVGEGMGGGGVG